MRPINQPGRVRRAKACRAVLTAGALLVLGAGPLRAEAPFLDAVVAPLDRQLIDDAIAEARTSGDVAVSVPKALMYKGMFLFQEEDYAASIPYLEEALRQDPTLVGAWESLGWAYWRTGQREKTARHFEALMRLMPDQPLAHNMMAQYGILTEDWERVDDGFRKSLELNPGQYEVRNWYAQNLLRLGRDREAQEILVQLVKEDPGRVDIIMVLAHIRFFERNYEESARMWRSVLAEIPENTDVILSLARTQLVLGNLEEADRLCLAALAIKPDWSPALLLRADIADIADLAAAAIDRLEAVIRATDDPLLRARLRERLAMRCQAMNNRTPGSVPQSVILGQLAKAVEEDPGNVFIQTMYAEYCLVFKQYDEARKRARLILETFNRHLLRAKEIFFECALGERRYDEAEQVLHDRYANYDGTDPLRNYHWARLELMRGNYVEALAQLDEMEAKASKGAVLTLLYHDLTESDWLAVTSVRRLYEHLFALKQAGFTFLSPTEIPELLGPAGQDTSAAERVGRWRDEGGDTAAVPLPARLVDSLRYAFTGERKFARRAKRRRMEDQWARPSKNVVITFDDGLRNAFELGTPIAEDLGVPFGMFVITKRNDFQPSVASWPLMKDFAAGGAWVIGSHLHDAHGDVPISSETNRVARALPNRVWLPGKGRIESMNEWDQRMRDNFRHSLKVLDEHLGEHASPVHMVAYPYGDIGQESVCNLSILRNPVKTILAEAARNYQLGFALNRSGYTCPGENNLLVRRYEPAWFAEGADVVRHAYENHPLFLARTLRIELAQVMGKPHLAEEMLEVLRRDGYPEALIRRIDFANRAHFRNRPQRTEAALVAAETAAAAVPPPALEPAREGAIVTGGEGTPVQAADDISWHTPSSPSVGAHAFHSQANDEYEVGRVGARAGINLGRGTWLGVEATHSEIEQERKPVRTLENPVDYDAAYRWEDSTANLTILPGAEAQRQDLFLRLSHRFESGASLSASLGLVRMTFDPHTVWHGDPDEWWSEWEGDSIDLVGDLAYNWYPSEKIGLSVFYAHDLLAVAYRPFRSHTVGINSRWKLSDSWLVDTRGQYALYDDDNAMYQFGADSFWEVHPAYGLWFGLQYAMATTSDYNPYYWTPYWDQRANAVLRYVEAWQGRSLNIDFIIGRQREDYRMQEYNDWAAIYDSSSDWSNAWGVGSTFRQRLLQNWELTLDLRATFLRSYADHSFYLSLDHTF